MTQEARPQPAGDQHRRSLPERWRRAVWLGSQTVRERRRFVARELLPRRCVASYRLRDAEAIVSIRHHDQGPAAASGDAWILYEVLHGGDYDPPAEVAAALSEKAGGLLRVVDLGANLGFFSLLVLTRYPGAQVTAFEPDPENAALLRFSLRRNGFDRDVEVIEACAHTEDGSLGFVGGLGCLSHVSFDGGDAEVPALDVFPYLADVDLLKVDIEGAEWPLLADERFATIRPRAIVLEYHSAGCPGDNAKREATDRLTGMGYAVHHPQPGLAPDSGPFWGAAVLWAHRKSER